MMTNSFRTRFSTLKRKVSSLQMEHGLLPDYLLMVKNNFYVSFILFIYILYR